MRTKLNTISKLINFANPSIYIPSNALLDAIALKFTLTVKNSNNAKATPVMKDVLSAITEIKLTTDATNVHYAVNGLDVARLNAFDSHSGDGAVLNKVCDEIAADAEGTIQFTLFLDQGDILAAQYDSIELKVLFKQVAFATGLTITNAVVNVTTVEVILTEAELQNMYGKNLEYFAEPKVVAYTKTNAANSEMRGFADLPTGTLLKRAMLTFSTIPEKFGVIATTPDLQNLMEVDWQTYRDMDAFKHFCNGNCPSDTVVIDYGSQLAANGQGLYAWNFRLGDYQIASKNLAETELRYVSCELIPKNQGAFEQLGVLETPYGI